MRGKTEERWTVDDAQNTSSFVTPCPGRVKSIVLSDAQAAELLGSCRSHFRNLHRMGKCPAPVKIGRSTKWREAELIDWLNAGCPPRHRWHWKPTSLRKGGR